MVINIGPCGDGLLHLCHWVSGQLACMFCEVDTQTLQNIRQKGLPMLRFVCLLLVGLLAAAPASAQSALPVGETPSPALESPTPVGVWLHANERIKIQIVQCGELLCGSIIWFKWPNDAQGLPLVDLKNADPALRARPLLGLTVLYGLRRTGKNTWRMAMSTILMMARTTWRT